jgi:alkylation response protein AidB-like acyl-CoA dehydrogenase
MEGANLTLPIRVLAAIEGNGSIENTNVISAGLSLLLGPEGRARQRRDATEIRRRGSVALVVALLAPGSGNDVEALTTTVAVAPRVLH